MAVCIDFRFTEEDRERYRFFREHPGLASINGVMGFKYWWRLKDDSILEDLYNEVILTKWRGKKQYKDILNRILTNLFKSNGEPVFFRRYQDNYIPGTFYGNEGISYRKMVNCLSAMEEIGLIKHGIGNNGSTGKYSYFQSTEKLQGILKEFCIKDSNISYERNWAVYLREPKTIIVETKHGNVELDTRRKFKSFTHTDKIKTLNKLLLRYNGFIWGVNISWNAPEEAQLYHKCLNINYEPELPDRSLYCIFNKNMSNGGRMYGAFWINMPKVLRPYLRIDGEQLVDIDFDACHIQLLYRAIKEDAPGNPYLYEKGQDERDIAKKLLLTILNYKSKKKHSDAQIRRSVIYASKVREDCYTDYSTAMDILIELENKHSPIKKYFYSGKGLSLQKKESDLMRKIMKQCINKGIPVLPCHDGCSVKISDADKVKDIFDRVTDLPATPEELTGDTDKIMDKIMKWLKWNSIDHRINDIKAEFNKILKGRMET